MSSNPIIQVDFKKRQIPKNLGGGLYYADFTKLDAKGNSTTERTFYCRPSIDGRRTWRKLAAQTERLARIELGKKRADQHMAKSGLAQDPFKKNAIPNAGDVLEFYQEANCPLRNESPRTGTQLSEEKKRIAALMPFWGRKLVTKITLEDCRDYKDWRIKQIKRGTGLRTVDLELCALSAAFTWALKNPRKSGVTYNPIAVGRTQYQKTSYVKHCRESMPETGDELHALARMLFQDPVSETLGWQLLIEAMVGQRSHEILRLRVDAANRLEPGFIQNNVLFLYRSATHKGTYPFIQIHDHLAQCLMAYSNWRTLRQIKSPWWFPNRRDPKRHLHPSSLSKALLNICPAMGIPHRTSNGLRSFYVNVLRSQEPPLPDHEIALRIGQKTGGRLIVEVYGEKLPYQLTWCPSKGEPAWEQWL